MKTKNDNSEMSWGPLYNINKEIKIGNLTVKIKHRPRHKNLWGRFGGGWNWKLGIMIGRTCIIFDILVFSVSFYWKRKEEKIFTSREIHRRSKSG